MQGKDKGNPRVDFLMVILASGIARGRTHNDNDDGGVAQHGGHTPKKRHTALVYRVHL